MNCLNCGAPITTTENRDGLLTTTRGRTRCPRCIEGCYEYFVTFNAAGRIVGHSRGRCCRCQTMTRESGTVRLDTLELTNPRGSQMSSHGAAAIR